MHRSSKVHDPIHHFDQYWSASIKQIYKIKFLCIDGLLLTSSKFKLWIFSIVPLFYCLWIFSLTYRLVKRITVRFNRVILLRISQNEVTVCSNSWRSACAFLTFGMDWIMARVNCFYFPMGYWKRLHIQSLDNNIRIEPAHHLQPTYGNWPPEYLKKLFVISQLFVSV